MSPLISAEELRAALAGGEPRVLIDTSFDLADLQAGEAAWRAGHLPGASYFHLERDLSGTKTGRNGRHPLPERAAFAVKLGHVGIGPRTQVIVYDRQGSMVAARLWWLLRWMGHESVQVLDGGLAAWTSSGGDLSTETPVPVEIGPYPERPPLFGTMGVTELGKRLGTVRLIDARAGERFRGETEPLDPAAGHIPGAMNRFFKDNLDANGKFRPAAELNREFNSLLGRHLVTETVHQCGSGVTACHNLLAMEHAGLPGSLLYPGSWSEWCADPARPVAQG